MQLTGKFTYVQWVIGFTVISYLIGLFGLKTIIVSTIPVLMFIYPLCVALIALIFLHKFFGGRSACMPGRWLYLCDGPCQWCRNCRHLDDRS